MLPGWVSPASRSRGCGRAGPPVGPRSRLRSGHPLFPAPSTARCGLRCRFGESYEEIPLDFSSGFDPGRSLGRQPTPLPPLGWRNLRCLPLSQHPSIKQEAIRVPKTSSGCLLVVASFQTGRCGQRALRRQQLTASAPTAASSAFSSERLALAAAPHLAAQLGRNSGVTKCSQICCKSLLAACERTKCIQRFKWETFITTGNPTAS